MIKRNGCLSPPSNTAGPDGRSPYGRSFCLSTSEDFENWSGIELIFHPPTRWIRRTGKNGYANSSRIPIYLTPIYNRPEEWRTDVYNFPVFRYEGLYLGLPVMHHWTGKRPTALPKMWTAASRWNWLRVAIYDTGNASGTACHLLNYHP